MATNAAPVYGKQYIRYAETYNAAQNAQVNSPVYNDAIAAGIPPALAGKGAVEVGELRVVAPIIEDGVNEAAQPDALAPGNWTGSSLGVNQAYMPTLLARPVPSRALTIATSGLLLVEVSPTASVIGLNTQLKVNVLGQAVAIADAGTLVTLDGTQPQIRENVNIGGRRLVLVSFA
jgi:hypothetical protein